MLLDDQRPHGIMVADRETEVECAETCREEPKQHDCLTPMLVFQQMVD